MGEAFRAELAARLDALAEEGLARELSLPDTRRIDFTSNDYLGLARREEVVEAARRATARHGSGARASRLLGGGAPTDLDAEGQLAAWLGAESALLFASGFQANLGLLGSLVEAGDALLSDERNHASLIDAARLSRGRRLVYRHEDLEHLEARLVEARGARRRWVVTEGIFSMDGDAARLAEISRLCARHDSRLLVDEAHAIGLVGPEGAGAWAAALAQDAEAEVLAARVVPCGKALGAQGGFVVGSTELRRWLLSKARSFVFSTGVVPAISGALTASIPLARGAERERAQLGELARELAALLEIDTPPAAIVPVHVGDNETAVARAASACEAGFEVRAVRPPTVPQGEARLRIVLHAYNDLDEVRALAPHLPPRDASSAPIEARAQPPRPAPLFVVGTDTEIGKTVTSALLVRAAARAGPVTYWKPVQTGSDSDTDTVRELTVDCDARFAEPCYAFPLPASPHEAAAEAGASIDVERLRGTLAELESRATPLVVELAGGLLVPYDDAHTQADWLAEERARLVLVARSGLGTLNHTLLTLEALRARRLEPEALLLVGEPHPSNRETLAHMGGVERIHELPRFDSLDAATLDAWLDAHDLRPLFTR